MIRILTYACFPISSYLSQWNNHGNEENTTWRGILTWPRPTTILLVLHDWLEDELNAPFFGAMDFVSTSDYNWHRQQLGDRRRTYEIQAAQDAFIVNICAGACPRNLTFATFSEMILNSSCRSDLGLVRHDSVF